MNGKNISRTEIIIWRQNRDPSGIETIIIVCIFKTTVIKSNLSR
jgi:hypothetical protein